MKKGKKIAAVLLTAIMATSLLAGCGGSKTEETKTPETQAAGETTAETAGETQAAAEGGSGSVYYLNFKPEVDGLWQELAASYTEQTGVPVTVVTAASGTYEQTLTSEIAKSEAPTLFQMESKTWIPNWGQYCYDLTDSYINQHSTYEPMTNEAGEVLGVPFAVESYGIIYNVDLMDEYCALDNAVVASADEITSFETLKAVADDIQARKDELGVEGAFSCAGLDGSSYWRFTTHLSNLPIYWEMVDKGVEDIKALDGTHVENFKNLIDLYFTDSTCEPALLSGKTLDDSQAEFVDGLAVFYQNGTWAWTADGDLADMNIAFLPLYCGVDAETDNIGVCTGTGNYWCVNKNSSPEDIQATLDFLEWVISSDEGKDTLAGAMAFNCPFDTFADYPMANPLFVSANAYTAAGKAPVSWMGLQCIPTENWKSDLASALIEYAQGTADWSNVEKVFTEEFASEWEANQQ